MANTTTRDPMKNYSSGVTASRHLITAIMVAMFAAILLISAAPERSVASAASAEIQPCEDDCNINVLFNFNSGMRSVYCYPDGHWHCTLFPDDEEEF